MEPTKAAHKNSHLAAISSVASLLGLATGAAAAPTAGQEPLPLVQDQRATATERALERGSQAPPFSLQTTEEVTWASVDQLGRVVVLEWVDAECPVVKRQHSPEGTVRLEALRTAGDRRISWLAVDSMYHPSAAGAHERASRARESLKIDYPTAMDPTGWVGRAYDVTRAGHVVVLDGTGKVIYSGAPDNRGRGQLLGLAIDAALGEKPLVAPRVPAEGCVIAYAEGVKLGAALPPMLFQLQDGQRRWSREMVGTAQVIEWFNPDCPVVEAAHGKEGAHTSAMGKWKALGGAWTLVNSAPIGHEATGRANQQAMDQWSLDAELALDPSATLRTTFGAEVTPQLFVTDARGVVVYIGAHTDEASQAERPLEVLIREMKESVEEPVKPRTTRAWGTPVKT